jgi:CheY-like chemotaxis protein
MAGARQEMKKTQKPREACLPLVKIAVGVSFYRKTNMPPTFSPTVPTTNATPLDVLFVDDDAEIASVMTRFLARYGYTVESAADGHAALRVLQRRPVSVVVTDILMPEVDGYELIMKLKQTPHRPRIIAMSGNPSKIGLDFLKSAQQLGADRVLAKPFMPQALLAIIEEMLGPRTPPPA